MNCVVFKTPTKLDLRAITTFGINAKPNSQSPIGFFGTGLKYAIAVCLREGCPVDIFIESKRYKFTTEQGAFRDKQFGFVYMSYQKKYFGETKVQLPFTTELGKTWQLWQAFRELHSNTLDERGTTQLYTEPLQLSAISAEDTYIAVRGAPFAQEYYDMSDTFLPGAARYRDSGDRVETRLEGSKYIYYRGMRVLELEQPARVTYNILADIDLTEDRTAKYAWQVESIIREHVVNCGDDELTKLVVESPQGTYEHRFNFANTYTPPSSEFASYCRTHRGAIKNETVQKYLEDYDPESRKKVLEPTLPEQFVKLLQDEDYAEMIVFLRDNSDRIIAQIKEGTFNVDPF